MANKWSKVILFGDSLTQHAYDVNSGYWAALLANRLQRICDVFCRGFSGYNTRYLKILAPQLFNQESLKDTCCFVLMIGSNDSCLKDSFNTQHVPLDEYKSNLRSIISILENATLDRKKIILITPPCYYHEKYTKYCKLMGKPLPSKSNAETKKYSQACLEVAYQEKIDCIDFFESTTNHCKGPDLFSDGLHLSRDGAQLLYELACPLVEKKIIHFHGPLEMNYPHYSEIDSQNPKALLSIASQKIDT